MFMSLLDATIVNVALPTIRTSLSASEATLSWIISGYALAFGLALIPAGRLGDRFGHKWVFFTGLALFTVASLACGLAQDGNQLIVARVVQGLAAGIYVPAVTAYIQLLFTGRTRGKAFAIMGAVIGVSSALGPLIGGLLIQAFGNTNGWRLVFVVNLPIGIIAVIAAVFLLPKGSESSGKSGGVDVLGLLLLSGGLVAILVPLIEGQDQGWPVWTYLSLIGGVALIALFGAWEVAVAKRGKSPLVPPHLFSHPAFTGGVILALVYFAAFVSIFFTISILWQAGLGHTALESGVVSIPFAVGSIVGASQSGKLAASIGRTVLVIGAGMVAVGLSALWLVLLLVSPGDLTKLGPTPAPARRRNRQRTLHRAQCPVHHRHRRSARGRGGEWSHRHHAARRQCDRHRHHRQRVLWHPLVSDGGTPDPGGSRYRIHPQRHLCPRRERRVCGGLVPARLRPAETRGARSGHRRVLRTGSGTTCAGAAVRAHPEAQSPTDRCCSSGTDDNGTSGPRIPLGGEKKHKKGRGHTRGPGPRLTKMTALSFSAVSKNGHA